MFLKLLPNTYLTLNLTSNLKQDGLPIGSLLPCLELVDDISFYSHISRTKVRFCVIPSHFFYLSSAKIVLSHETTKLVPKMPV